jgi:hypothetical protein
LFDCIATYLDRSFTYDRALGIESVSGSPQPSLSPICLWLFHQILGHARRGPPNTHDEHAYCQRIQGPGMPDPADPCERADSFHDIV